jgi:hypothetical protein
MPLAKPTIRNSIVFVAVSVAYFIYMRFVSNALPDSWGGEINVLVVPFVLGAICAFAFAGHLLLRVALLICAAVLVLIAITGGGDPAKPGLHLWVAAAMVLIASIGMLCAALAGRLIGRVRRPA